VQAAGGKAPRALAWVPRHWCWTASSRHSSGTPFRRNRPWSAKEISESVTKSLTVRVKEAPGLCLLSHLASLPGCSGLHSLGTHQRSPR
jgi:hypothetical protein